MKFDLDFTTMLLLANKKTTQRKYYDFEKACELISRHSINKNGSKAISVEMGMKEDWSATRADFHTENLPKDGIIGGIDSSNWATPILCITYEDGSELDFDCYLEKGST